MTVCLRKSPQRAAGFCWKSFSRARHRKTTVARGCRACGENYSRSCKARNQGGTSRANAAQWGRAATFRGWGTGA